MAALVVFKQMLSLLIMMGIGFYCKKTDRIDDKTYPKLSWIVVNILNPLLMVNGVINKEHTADNRTILINLCMMLFYFAFLALCGLIITKILFIKKTEEDLYQMMIVFSNVGFMGIPVISSIYGSECVLFIDFYILGYNVLLYTYCVHLVEKNIKKCGSETDKENVSRSGSVLIRIINPGVIASIIAIVLFISKLPVPSFIENCVSYLGNAAVPFSMILIGASVASKNIKDLLNEKKVYPFLLIRLLAIPIAAALIIKALPIQLPEMVFGVFIMMLAMPVGSIVVLMASEKGANETCLTRGIVLSTLAAVVTIPIVALFI